MFVDVQEQQLTSFSGAAAKIGAKTGARSAMAFVLFCECARL